MQEQTSPEQEWIKSTPGRTEEAAAQTPDEHAADFAQLPADRVAANLDIAKKTFSAIEDFDTSNPLHMDIRNRMLGLQQLSVDQGDHTSPDLNGDKKYDDSANGPYKYAQRNDGGIDIVTGDINTANLKIVESRKAVANAFDHAPKPPRSELQFPSFEHPADPFTKAMDDQRKPKNRQ